MGLVISNPNSRWPNNQIPYLIDPGIANNATSNAAVLGAIQYWNNNTLFRLFPKRANDVDYVVFAPDATSCNSAVGRIGGRQLVSCALASGSFNTSSVIHEIAHTVGFFHEHMRIDRDRFVTVLRGAILPDHWENDFKRRVGDGVDVGRYDYASIMHYPRSAFARIPGHATILAPEPIGVASTLSQGDLRTALAIATPTNGFSYYLVAQHSQKCLDVHAANQMQDGRVCQAIPNSSDAQIWKVDEHPDLPGTHILVARVSGKCLTARPADPLEGALVVQSEFSLENPRPQAWRILPHAKFPGYFTVRAESTENCLDVKGRSQIDNADVCQAKYNETPAQAWRFDIA